MKRSSFLLAPILILCGLILASCEALRPLAARTDLATLPPELTAPQPRAARLPDPATIGQVIEISSRDAANLNQCAATHAALVKAIEVRDGLQGSPEAAKEGRG